MPLKLFLYSILKAGLLCIPVFMVSMYQDTLEIIFPAHLSVYRSRAGRSTSTLLLCFLITPVAKGINLGRERR